MGPDDSDLDDLDTDSEEEFDELETPTDDGSKFDSASNLSRIVQDAALCSDLASAVGELESSGTTSEEPTDGKISLKEASHRLRLAQDLVSGLQAKKPQKYREMMWNNVAKQIEAIVNPKVVPSLINRNVSTFMPLTPGKACYKAKNQALYLSEVLDIYRKGSNSRYNSIESAADTISLSYLSPGSRE
ncbi:hypothetical protein EDD85DRAFT_948137 [Armillaria nabsnona]|nr:hypothetical protein EDD85DRAFT_948137 [Armillaria nabsnona]